MNTFKDIPQIRYEGANSKNPFSFKFYDAERQIGGKAMKEHLKFAMSWWHTLCAAGTDPFGDDTHRTHLWTKRPDEPCQSTYRRRLRADGKVRD